MSRLIEILELIYLWQDDEIADIAQSLEERMRSAWRDTLQKLAQQHGCRSARPNNPSGEDLAGLRRLADEDARSIANTWGRDVRRQLTALYQQNPRGNRNYYIKNMEAWARKRGRWKNLQIGNATEQRAAWFTKELFYTLNGLQTLRSKKLGWCRSNRDICGLARPEARAWRNNDDAGTGSGFQCRSPGIWRTDLSIQYSWKAGR